MRTRMIQYRLILSVVAVWSWESPAGHSKRSIANNIDSIWRAMSAT